MKVSQCDQCEVRMEADRAYGNPPKGWISITFTSKDPTKYEVPRDFCSERCATEYLMRRQDQAAIAPEAVPSV